MTQKPPDLVVYTKKKWNQCQINTVTPIFTEVLITIAKILNQTKCPSL